MKVKVERAVMWEPGIWIEAVLNVGNRVKAERAIRFPSERRRKIISLYSRYCFETY